MQYKTTILWGLMLGLPMYLQAAEPVALAVNNSSSFEIRQVQPNILERRQDANLNMQMNMVSPIPVGADQVKFVLNSLQLEGNQALSTQKLASAWQTMLGQQVTLADISTGESINGTLSTSGLYFIASHCSATNSTEWSNSFAGD